MSFSRATRVGTYAPYEHTPKSLAGSNNSNAQRIKALNNTVKNMVVQLDQSIDRATVCIAHKKNTFDNDLLKRYIGPLLANRETLDASEILEISNIIANNST